MKPKFLCFLFVLISFSWYANAIAIKIDTGYTIAQARRMAKKHIRVSREAIKGYKPAFDNCSFTNKFTLADRLKKYPYATAFKIMAVSYYGGPEPNLAIKSDSLYNSPPTNKQKQHYRGLVIEHNRLNYATLIETKVLNQRQVADLTNIIFNYDFAGMRYYTFTGTASCFLPRNSILFLDKNGHVIDHLDICFECRQWESASGKLTIGTDCSQKFDMLARFFIKAGVKYGADKGVPLN